MKTRERKDIAKQKEKYERRGGDTETTIMKMYIMIQIKRLKGQ